MTTQELIDLYKLLTDYDLDQRGGNTNSAIVLVLNEALRNIAKSMTIIDPLLALNLNNDDGGAYPKYHLANATATTKQVLELYTVTINGFTLLSPDRTRPGTWTFPEFEACYPSWMAATASTPVVGVWMNAAELLIWPPPSAEIKASTKNYICAKVLPPNLSAAALSASPAIPTVAHEAIAYEAAWISASATASEKEQLLRIEMFKDRVNKLVTDAARETSSSFFNSTNQGYMVIY